MAWLDLLVVHGTLKSLLQHYSSKASVLRRSAFFTVQLSHPYMTTRKTIALTATATAKSLQSCPTLCNPIDSLPPGSPVPGILQARILKWLAIPFSSGPCSVILLWEIDGETVETVSDFIFLGSKITADGACSHQIKRLLLLERKVMTNLDSIFKSRDITLPTKVHLVKSMVFPVVMYGCES